MKETKLQKGLEKRYGSKLQNGKNKINWIEILLLTPIEDYRKHTLPLILAPYLINIKKLSYNDSFLTIKDWLDNCDELRKLDANFEYRIKYSLNEAITKHRLPIKFDTLKDKNQELHNLLIDKMRNWEED
jgi:Primase X